MQEYWQIETLLQPSFPNMMWSRPENKAMAVKLLIIGGNAHGFSVPVSAYSEAQKAGAGSVHVLLPEATKKIVGYKNTDVGFAPSNTSGGFNQQALGEFLNLSEWSDGCLLSGEMGNNSETVVMVEQFLIKYDGLVVSDYDCIDMLLQFHAQILKRESTVLVTDINRLQRLQTKAKELHCANSGMSLANLVINLHEFTINHKINLVLDFGEYLIVASEGRIASTKITEHIVPETRLAVHSAVWAIQNPDKIFEALSCAILTSLE